MSVLSAFADYLESTGVATRGQDLFTSRAPSSKALQQAGAPSPDRIFWIKASPGSAPERMVNGSSVQSYGIDLYHRNLSADDVSETLEAITSQLTCSGCVSLTGYSILGVEVEGPWSDQDLDNEERTVGLLQITITIYKEC